MFWLKAPKTTSLLPSPLMSAMDGDDQANQPPGTVRAHRWERAAPAGDGEATSVPVAARLETTRTVSRRRNMETPGCGRFRACLYVSDGPTRTLTAMGVRRTTQCDKPGDSAQRRNCRSPQSHTRSGWRSTETGL